MKTQICEVTNGPNNWGKFLVGIFDDEWQRTSIISKEYLGAVDYVLLRQVGWERDDVLVLDLQTCEGAVFAPYRSTSAHHDLHNHRIWVCPLYEPFLCWLYIRAKALGLDELPGHVDIPEAAFEFRGYRRPGP